MTRVPAEAYRRCNALIIVSHQEAIWRAQKLVLTPPASGHALVRATKRITRILPASAQAFDNESRGLRESLTTNQEDYANL